MSDRIVFRSTHPVVVESWDAYLAARRGFTADLVTVAAEIDPDGKGRKMLAFDGSWGSFASGLAVIPEDATHPPEGWRVQQIGKTHLALVPIRRTKIGREISERIKALRLPEYHPPGMPSESWPRSCNPNGSTPVYRPGVRRIDGAIYCVWNGEADLAADRLMSDGKTVDPEMWEPCPLSAYYAAVEAHAGDES